MDSLEIKIILWNGMNRSEFKYNFKTYFYWTVHNKLRYRDWRREVKHQEEMMIILNQLNKRNKHIKNKLYQSFKNTKDKKILFYKLMQTKANNKCINKLKGNSKS
jgi:hypothetical protein